LIKIGLCGFTIAIADYPLYFPVVEIQHTFYQPPTDAVVARWVKQMPRGFEFTLKAWQLVTHAGTSPTYKNLRRPLTAREREQCGSFRDTAIVREGLARSLECAAILRATALLFQCPASFGPTPANVERLRAFCRKHDRKGLVWMWEPRGPAWVKERALALELCRELDLVHVVDPFATRPEPGGRVYWRLHGMYGNARHVYTDDELDRLIGMLEDVGAAAHAETAHVMFNEIPRAADAKRFLRRLAF
jgi:uncharacterized protein YecE (DUF72 family)